MKRQLRSAGLEENISIRPGVKSESERKPSNNKDWDFQTEKYKPKEVGLASESE